MTDHDNDGPASRLGKGVDRTVFDAAMMILHDGEAASDEAVDGLVELAGRGRPAHRAVAAALQRAGSAVLPELSRRADLEPETPPRWERLLRLAAGGERRARRRTNPIARNEGFVCGHCGRDVEPGDRGVQRNHCPFCLTSLHVDVVPGDRAEDCGGLMHAVALESVGDGRAVIVHRCERCGIERRVRAASRSARQPDDPAALRELSRRLGEFR